LQGRTIWERTFGARLGERRIESLAPPPSGEIVVAGRDADSAWLARISPEGKVIWERFFGTAKGAAVTAIGDKFFVVAFSAHNASKSSYREDLTVWIFDRKAVILDRRIVREEVNAQRNAYFGRVLTRRSSDSVYVFSAWSALDFCQAKLPASLCTRILPDTASA